MRASAENAITAECGVQQMLRSRCSFDFDFHHPLIGPGCPDPVGVYFTLGSCHMNHVSKQEQNCLKRAMPFCDTMAYSRPNHAYCLNAVSAQLHSGTLIQILAGGITTPASLDKFLSFHTRTQPQAAAAFTPETKGLVQRIIDTLKGE